MDRATLQLLSHEFRDLVSQTSRSHHSHLQTNLQRLLDFIADTPLLASAVEEAPRPAESPTAVLVQCRTTRQRIQPVRNRREELGFLHDLLAELAGASEGDFRGVVLTYGHHSKFRDHVDAFVADTVTPYATNLRRVITAALTSVGAGPSPRLEINTSGGLSQVVVHQGVGDLSAAQVADQYANEIVKAADALRAFVGSPDGASLSADESSELAEIASEVPAEIAKESPSKWGLKAMQERLTFFLSTSAAADKLRPHLEPLVGAVDRWLEARGLK